jgi:LDH2 family malate/lactate/ureidoglycolate dehydrogenase
MEAPSSKTRLSVPAATLHDVIRCCFRAIDISEEDATAVADALIYANLRGIDSHGFERVPSYMRRVKTGLSGGTERLTVVTEHGPLCRLDAGHALGPAAGVTAIDTAIRLAGEFGVGVVAVGNATNFGAAGFYAARAARQDLLAAVATNAPKLMAPHGAAEPFLGSNAIAIASPLDDEHGEFVLDMSTTVTARGKVRRAKTLGTSLQPGLALDREGNPTTDPAQALVGSMLPVGGSKGSGLALAITIIVALLAEADFDYEVASIYDDPDRPQNLGHLFFVVDPWRLTSRESGRLRLAALVDRLHALRPQKEFQRVRYAGEGGAEHARHRLEYGIPVETADLQAVAEACRDCGVPRLAERVEALRWSDK